MMRRHLLTLFALFSGLAALCEPAQASALEATVFDARAFASANDISQSEACHCPVRDQVRAARWIKRQEPAPVQRAPVRVGAPVIPGTDRSLE